MNREASKSSLPVEREQPWGTMIWMAGSDVGNIDTLTLGRMIMQPGTANDMHSHANCEEIVCVLSGHVQHSIGGEVVEQKPGTVVVVPKGAPHNTVNIGPGIADILIAFPVGAREFKTEH